jgi:predicted RNA-binding protein YlqC (UPF0109 family)
MDFTELIRGIICNMVDDEKSVDIQASEAGNSTMYFVKVAKSDLGRVIGKQGKTIQALEHILSRWSGKYRLRLMMEIDKG